jgi:hypothetical protein
MRRAAFFALYVATAQLCCADDLFKAALSNVLASDIMGHFASLEVEGTGKSADALDFSIRCSIAFLQTSQTNFNKTATPAAFSNAVFNLSPPMVRKVEVLADCDSRTAVFALVSGAGHFVKEGGAFETKLFNQAFENIDEARIARMVTLCALSDSTAKAVAVTFLLAASSRCIDVHGHFDAVRFNERLSGLDTGTFTGATGTRFDLLMRLLEPGEDKQIRTTPRTVQ